jgi:hypothetical protein
MMFENSRRAEPAKRSQHGVEFSDGEFVVDARLLGELLGIPASRVSVLMRERAITSICERGIDDHEGEFRLTFFHLNRRARLSTDMAGRILRRSVIDFGERPLPERLHRPDR